MEVVKFLLRNSTGVPIGNHGNGETPLLAACRHGNLKIVDALVARFSSLLFVVDEQNMRSPLHFSCHRGDVGIVKVLLEAVRVLYDAGTVNKDLNLLDKDRRTPLYNACHNGQVEVVELLLQFKQDYPDKIDVNAEDIHRRTALHVAISAPKHSEKIVKLLLAQEELVVNVEGAPSIKAEKFLCKLLEHRHSTASSPIGLHSISGSSLESIESTPSATPISSPDGYDIDSDVVLRNKKAVTFLQTVSLARPISPLSDSPKLNVYRSSKGYLEVHKHPPDSSYVPFKEFLITPLAEACIYRNKEIVDMLLHHGALDVNGLACQLSYIVRPSLANLILSTQCQLIDEDNQVDQSHSSGPIYTLNWSERHLREIDAKLFHLHPLYSFDHGPRYNVACREISCTVVDYSCVHTVHLQKNELRFVPVELFQLPNVCTIDLSQNELMVLLENEEANIRCQELRVLKLSNNKLSCLPSSLWLLPSLQKLFVDQNELKSLISSKDPSKIDDIFCPSLEEINLSRNKLEGLQDFLFLLPQLTKLDLSRNKLVCLPYSLWLCESLQKLKLSHNELSYLPHCETDELHDLLASTANKPLDLLHWANPINQAQATLQSDFNHQASIYKDSVRQKSKAKDEFKIRQIIENEQDGGEVLEVCDYSTLTHLDLSNNNFQRFPQGLSCLAPNVTELDVSKNPITTIDVIFLPPSIRKLTAANCGLERIGNTLTNSQIKQVKRKCYHDNKSLQCLHRSHTSLQYLQTLKLAGNRIKRFQLIKATLKRSTEDPTRHESEFIPNSSFDSLKLLYPSLEGLDLTENCLEGTFNPNIGRQTQLKWIKFSDNKNLEELPLHIALLKNTRRLTQIEINNMPSLRVPPVDYQKQRVQTGQLLTYMRSRLKK